MTRGMLFRLCAPRAVRTAAMAMAALLVVHPLVSQESRPVAAVMEGAVAEALAAPPAAAYDDLYDACQVRVGRIEPLLAALDAASAAGATGRSRDAAAWIRSFCLWRDGRIRSALDALGQIDVAGTWARDLGPRLAMRRGQLLDALDRRAKAREAYEEALAGLEGTDEELEADLRLRLAVLGDEGGGAADPAALVAFATGSDRDGGIRNRAANILALQGQPARALDVYVMDADEATRARDEVRLATWAIRAGDAPRAQDLAWAASRGAKVSRDRYYALSVLVEAHRLDDSLPALIDRFAATPDLDEAARMVWIDLLRETGRVDEAVAMLGDEARGFAVDLRRQLVDMYREAGREAEMVAAYRRFIEEEPARVAWREGLCRHFLERGDTEQARDVWRSLLDDPAHAQVWLEAAEALFGVSLDDMARATANALIEADVDRDRALMFLFELELVRGEQARAEAVLDRMDGLLEPDAGQRAQLGEAFERLGKLERAVAVLERLRAERGEARMAEDLEMRLAWLYSQVDREEAAMRAWFELWRRVDSVPRRRYVEDRLMTVAARLGRLGDLVVDLEQKLVAGDADKHDSGLLVRLYTKVNDPVSATEVVDEFLETTGGDQDPVETLLEKGRIYLACTDYRSYEETLRELMRIDPEGETEHLRSLVMSQLERGRPDEARDALARLRQIESGSDGAEFEAGVLALAGLREDARAAYRKGISQHPDRIEIYLLLANLMGELGEADRAVGMFQFLAETAEKDDLFTIAIDGLLNMEASPAVLRWARRVTLERMARRHDKMYLYQLLADLSGELRENEAVLDALEGSLAIAGVRRPSVLRELMDLAKSAGERERHLAYGRRLISLEEIVPPQVYLDLGEAFLSEGEIRNAVKTFALAKDLPDRDAFERRIAQLYEDAGYAKEALRTYERVMIGDPTDVALMTKVAALKEQTGRDDVARELYERSLVVLMSRQNLVTEKVADESDQPAYFARNTDEFDTFFETAVIGVLVTTPSADLPALLDRMTGKLRATLQQVAAEVGDGVWAPLAQYPRLERWVRCCRRLCFATGALERLHELDLELLARFARDEDLLERCLRVRLEWGCVGAARRLLAEAPCDEAEKRRWSALVGGALDAPGLLEPAEVAGLMLPALARGDTAYVAQLLQKADLNRATGDALEHVAVLHAAARYLGDADLALAIGRDWIRVQLGGDASGAFQAERLYRQIRAGLDAERARGLTQYFASLILDDLDRAKNIVRVLPELQDELGEDLLTPEQIRELLAAQRLEYPYGLGPLLGLLPEEERTAAVRELWPKVPNTARVRFLLTVASEFPVEMGDTLADFVVEALDDAIRDDDEKFLYYESYLRQLQGQKVNRRAARRIAETLSRARPDEITPRTLLIVALEDLGETDAALAQASELLKATIQGEVGDWRKALTAIAEEFLPAHLDRFVADIDGLGEGSLELAERRVELITRGGDDARTLAALEAAVAAHSDNFALRDRTARQLERSGRARDALQMLEAFVEEHPKHEAARRRLSALWETVGHPVRALEVLGDLAVAPAGGRAAAGARAMRLATPGVAVIRLAAPSGAFTATRSAPAAGAGGDDEDPNKLPPATPATIRSAMERGDPAAAKVAFRRLWRFGGRPIPESLARLVSSGQIRLPAGYAAGNPPWPQADAGSTEAPERGAEEDETATPDAPVGPWGPRARGGLATIAQPSAAAVATTRQTTYEALSDEPWAIDEMERQMRSLRPWQLEAQDYAVDPVQAARIQERGAEVVYRELIDRSRAGTATRADYTLLLELVKGGAIERGDEVRGVLAELLAIQGAGDGPAVQSLARMFHELGDRQTAESLYLWCAALCGATGLEGRGVDARGLVAAAREVLEGEVLFGVVEAAFDATAPADPRYELENHELLVMETWRDLLDDPAEVVRRCRDVLEGVTDTSASLRRRSALLAAQVYAAAGEAERAVACLEVAWCKLDPPETTDRLSFYTASQYTRPGPISRNTFDDLFPGKGGDEGARGRDLEAWLRAAGRMIPRWIADGRVNLEPSAQALAVVAWRLAELEATDRAREIVGFLDSLDLDPATELWGVDAARAAGDEGYANGVERQLFETDRLVRARVAEVVRRIAEAEGAAAGIDAGARAAELCLDPGLLATLVDLCVAEGRDADAARWRELDTAAKQARASLAAKRAEARQAARR